VLDTKRRPVSFSGPAPVVVNAGRKSYVRVRYGAGLFTELVAHLRSLTPADQIGALQDAWALAQSQYAPITNLLSLIDALPHEADPIVWLRAVGILEALDRRYAGLPAQGAYRDWARSRLAPIGARFGWDQSPGEATNASLLRMPVLVALSRFGDPAVIAEARRRDAAASADPSSESPEARRIARRIVARNANPAAFGQLIDQLHTTRDPLRKQDLLEALTDVADPALAQRLLEIIIGPDVPAGSMPQLLLDVALEHPDLTWKFAVDHVDAPGFPMDRSTRMEVLPSLTAPSSDMRRAEELRRYAAAHLPAAASRRVNAAVAEIELNARVRSAELPRIDEWLRAERR
jgi:aminopeptidase N